MFTLRAARFYPRTSRYHRSKRTWPGLGGTSALGAAGIDHRRVYDCRHTFASWSIRAGVQLFYLSRIMGTSVAQIDATYGHLVSDSDEYLRGLLDQYDDATLAERAAR
jgi:integrase